MKKYSAEEREMWVEDWRQSGASIWAYAKANGLSPMTLKNWAQRSEGAPETPAPRFVEVRPPASEQHERTAEILIEKGDVKIHIPLAINRGELRAVIEGLGWQA
jgi:transposase-like protein